MEHSTRQQRTAAIGLVVIMVAGLFALFGTYWDNAWHTDVGRDEFFSPPHLVLYAGVAVMGGVVSLWALLAWLETRSLRAVFARPALRLGMIGVVATFLAAPLDEFWHHAFGRDSVIWSPPHMIGFAALFALATGFLLEAARVPGRLGAALTVVMAALLLGAVHVTVMEYESDVPQFAALWYLPVLTLGTTLAFVIIENQRRVAWMATAAAVVYIAVRAGIIGLLVALDHSLLFIPPIVLPAVVFDLGARRGWSPAMRGLAYAASIVMVYTPFLNLMEGGIRLGAGDVIVGGLLAAAAAGLVLAAFHSPLPRPAPRHAVALLAALLLVPSEARAHDPGQGAVVGEARLLAVQEGGLVTLAVHVTPEPGRGCAEYEPRGLVARRAGAALRGALTRAAACRYRGQIELPDRGRWFVYVELELDGEVAETWMPVVAPSQGGQSVRTADIYIPPAVSASYSLVQILSGVALYGVVFWFLALAVGAARQRESARAERHRRRGAPSARPAGGRA